MSPLRSHFESRFIFGAEASYFGVSPTYFGAKGSGEKGSRVLRGQPFCFLSQLRVHHLYLLAKVCLLLDPVIHFV
jgi:hypothetical protein